MLRLALAGAGDIQAGILGGTGGRRDLGESEIQNLGVAAGGDENVRGLDVPMDDSFGMGGVKGVGDFYGQRKNFFVIYGAARDAVLSASGHPGTPLR